ncbi:RNA polymerase sigma factor [Methylotenera versatilis]|uniref:RNA polymerase sigma factor n=1 Tax=Methylotenera versatilis TaxID=1055487 RepID=UPI0006455AD7|nr:sigma-70 family RNA polymerase sigma factor [Methylotenera versatilis]
MIALSPSNKTSFWYGLDLRWVYTDLLKHIFFHTKCIHAAQDVLHDALLRFAFSRHGSHADEPHAYLRTVVKNLLTDNFQLSSRFVTLSNSADDQTIELHLADYSDANWALSPEKILDIQQRLQSIQQIINCLPPKCREVFWLFRIEGLRQAEIAVQLNISVNMVERHVIRALIDIRAAREKLA